MKIGIGVTTYNRPECLAKWKEQIAKHTSMDNVLIYIAIDTDQDRQGVAKRKNECLRALKDCDHIFLFDDDCWPIADGWVNFFTRSGNEHLLFLNDKLHNPFSAMHGRTYYRDCGGVFMYMTKKCVEKVGAFNENFKVWGFEHAEYSIRILGKHGEYPALFYTHKYLYAADYSDPSHRSSISAFEKQKYFNENLPIFRKPIKNTYLPL